MHAAAKFLASKHATRGIGCSAGVDAPRILYYYMRIYSYQSDRDTRQTNDKMVTQFQVFCRSCIRGTRTFAGRYRSFLLDPGTLFTLASFVLLVAAIIQSPRGLVDATRARSALYFASAIVGSVFIWWSAYQGIREGDFTADIPVSLATAAAIAIGQYSAAAEL